MIGVAGAIPGLVMVPHHGECPAEEGDASKHSITNQWMCSHHGPLFRSERAWLQQDRIRDADLSYVMNHRPPLQVAESSAVLTKCSAHEHGSSSHFLCVVL